MAPPAIASSGWKIYLFFMVFNILPVPFVYFFCPETQGKTLEEIDYLFTDKSMHETVMLEAVSASPKETQLASKSLN